MKLRNLVFSGCGIRVIGHVGFLKAISESFDLEEINTFCGSSAGAFIALCMVLNYSIEEIRELLIHLDYLKMADIKVDNVFNYFTNFGLDDGTKIDKLVKLILEKKTNKSEITFEDLFNLTKKKLVICVTNVTKECVEYISHITHPDFSVNCVLRMSASIPFYFTPVYYRDNIFIDGGVTDNFPIQLFDEDDTLGMYLKLTGNQNIKVDNILLYNLSIVNTILRNNETEKLELYKNNTIIVENDQHATEFKISKEDRIDIFNLAYDKTKEFINLKLSKLKESQSNTNNNDNESDISIGIKGTEEENTEGDE